VAPPSLVSAHRSDLTALTGLAERDLAKLFGTFDTAAVAREALLDLLPQLVELYGAAAATLGADWYDDLRAAMEVPGSFRAAPARLPDRGRTDALARWGVSPLFAAEPDFGSALSLVSGGLQRIVADASRDTVLGSLREDPRGHRWSRKTSAGSCGFCQMLSTRDNYLSESTAGFESHDHCHCLAIPAWS
jgi:hypothetical protein